MYRYQPETLDAFWQLAQGTVARDEHARGMAAGFTEEEWSA